MFILSCYYMFMYVLIGGFSIIDYDIMIGLLRGVCICINIIGVYV